MLYLPSTSVPRVGCVEPSRRRSRTEPATAELSRKTGSFRAVGPARRRYHSAVYCERLGRDNTRRMDMQSEQTGRPRPYLAYSAESSEDAIVRDALDLIRGDRPFTPRERITVLTEMARARADYRALKEAIRQ